MGAIAMLVVGQADNFGPDVPPVIDAEALERVSGYAAAAEREGEIAARAQPPAADGCFCPALLAVGLPERSPVLREEVFGPLLAVTRVPDLDAACDVVDSLPFALTGGLFSRSPVAVELSGRPTASSAGQKQPSLPAAPPRAAISPSRSAARVARHALLRLGSITGGTSVANCRPGPPRAPPWRRRAARRACRRSRSCASTRAAAEHFWPGVAERRVHDRRDGLVEVGVRIHDHAVLPAHLGHDALHVRLARPASRRRRARSRGRPRSTR